MLAALKKRTRLSPVGIDIGAGGIRAVQLQHHDAGWVVVQSITLPGTFDEVGDGQETLSMALHRGLGAGGFRGTRAVALLDSPDLDYFAIEVPEVPPHEARNIARLEVERLLTEDRAVEVDLWRTPRPRGSANNAVAVAASTAAVLRVVQAFEAAGWLCLRVDAGAAALARFGALLQSPGPSELWGMLDLGARQARLIVALGETPVLVRSVGPGGAHWTQRIADSLQISTKAAEVHKCDHGIVRCGRGSRADERSVAQSELGGVLFGALRSELHDLASEIRRSFSYVLSCFPQSSVTRLVLAAGGASTRNLPEYLEDALSIEVRRATELVDSPGCRVSFRSARRRTIEEFALAIGAAAIE